MGDSVGEKVKASGKAVLTGEKEENRVGGSQGRGPQAVRGTRARRDWGWAVGEMN